MRAAVLPRVASLAETELPLELRELPVPEPGPGEIRIAVSVCGVCHTELDEIEGRTLPSHFPMVLGHEVVGQVDRQGVGARRWNIGQRVGVGWIHHSDGTHHENLSRAFRATGRDVPGGYAEYMTVPEPYAYAIPSGMSDEQAAPLLCAGSIGYRALRLTGLRDGEPLGLTGFGGSAHLVLPLARHLFPRSAIYVFARDPGQRTFARELGAVWAGGTAERAPERLQAIIDTTPAWKPVVEALANLRPGGRLVINAIRKQDADKSCLTQLSYAEHLWEEREIKSVANITGRDIAEFLGLAGELRLRPEVQVYPLEEVNRALLDLHRGGFRGAKVLRIR